MGAQPVSLGAGEAGFRAILVSSGGVMGSGGSPVVFREVVPARCVCTLSVTTGKDDLHDRITLVGGGGGKLWELVVGALVDDSKKT